MSELRNAFRELAAAHLRRALNAVERADDTEAGMELASAAVALAEAGVLPQLETDPVAMIYERRTTACTTKQTLTVTRRAPRRRAQKPQDERATTDEEPTLGGPRSLH